jgi:hypothetical protein
MFILFSHLPLGRPSGLVPPGFRTKTFYAFLFTPVGTTYSVHPILLHVITYTTFGDQYKSLCNN